MKIVYEAQASAKCPVDGAIISYGIAIGTDEMIFVEEILEKLAELTAEPTTQELLTLKISEAWPFARITTIGTHSGVRITCHEPDPA